MERGLKSSAFQTPRVVLPCFKNCGMLDELGTRGTSRVSDAAWMGGTHSGVVIAGFAALKIVVTRAVRCSNSDIGTATGMGMAGAVSPGFMRDTPRLVGSKAWVFRGVFKVAYISY